MKYQNFSSIEQKITSVPNLGYCFDYNFDINTLYSQFLNPQIKENYNVEIRYKGYYTNIELSENKLQCKIKYYKFNSIVLKYTSESTSDDVVFYTKYRKNYLSLTIDLESKSVYSKVSSANNYIPVTFNNIDYTTSNPIVLKFVYHILNCLKSEKNTFDFSIEDLKYSTSNTNIYSILEYESKRKFVKEINNNSVVNIPNWSLKTSPEVLNYYIKLSKKTEIKSLGIVKDFFNKNYLNIESMLNCSDGNIPIFNMINEIYKHTNPSIFDDFNKIKNFSPDEYYDYCTTILERRFKECKFNFNIKSLSRLKTEHDKLFRIIKEKEQKKLKLVRYKFNDSFKSIIKYLSSKEIDIKLIKTNRELLNYATYMNNCVFSYNTSILKSKSLILNGTFQKESHCIHLYKSSSKIKIAEIKRRFNKEPNTLFESRLVTVINSFNDSSKVK